MKKYIRNNKTIADKLHDELVMMDIDMGKYFSLNPVATRIWDLLEQPLSIEEICKVLLEEFEVNKEQCIKEVQEHITEMKKLGLIFEE